MSLSRYRQHLLLAWAVLPTLALAAPATVGTDAGSLLRDGLQTTPAPSPKGHVLPNVPTEPQVVPVQDTVKVHVKSVRFHGVRAFPESVLLSLLADAQGKDLDFKQLQELSERITTYYRAQGYLLAHAYLPAQKIADGAIEIAVTEGRLGQLTLHASTPAHTEPAKAYVADLRLGEALQSAPLERDLLLLSDLPGVNVQPTLHPGETVGTSNLDIQVKSNRAINGSATLDNHGNHYTGEARASGHLNVANPFRFGDSLDLSATYAGSSFRYGRLAWQTPIGGQGLQVGVAGSVMGYALGQEFANLNASGHANDLTFYALHSLVRSQTLNVQTQAALDLKHFDDALNGSSYTKRVQVLSLGLSGSSPTPWGASTQGTVTLTIGQLVLDTTNTSLDPSGGYTKIGFQGEYQQPLGRNPAATRTTLALKVSGQGAGKNLDSSEKIALGGPQGVRAYATGEGSVDDALLASAELRYRWGAQNQAHGKWFIDAAKGIPVHIPLANDSAHIRNLAGTGFGLDLRMPYDVLLQTSVAWRMVGMPSANLDRSPRLWVLLTKGF
ncbi:ShlB/FhaC/HecB family hemolysin secretion/activation protein [Leptothrix ochracea]|uniref:ShlB/FhaC/HecB family hemolysin secretion/activation protein n=1 Tax=Leptothrix ochracea TaxID=735331 RepID=UPI0034E23D7E